MAYSKIIQEKLSKIGQFDNREIIGCSKEEIALLEQQLWPMTKLPSSYLDFLSVCGKGIADFQPTTDFYYNAILRLNKKEKQNTRLPENAFIIMSHLSYSYRFILLDKDGCSSPVYLYSEGEGTEQLYSSFEECFLDLLEDFHTLHQTRVSNFPKMEAVLVDFKKQLFNILEYIHKKDLSTKTKAWVSIFKTYQLILTRVYNLYSFNDPTSLSSIDAYLNLYSVYEKDEMGPLWEGVVDQLIDIEEYFNNKIVATFQEKRMSSI